MKAACLILCLALARESAGHIFRRQQQQPQRIEDLMVQPLNYIDQQQMQEQMQQQRYPGLYQRYIPQQRQYASEEYQKNLKRDQSSEEYKRDQSAEQNQKRDKYAKQYQKQQKAQQYLQREKYAKQNKKQRDSSEQYLKRDQSAEQSKNRYQSAEQKNRDQSSEQYRKPRSQSAEQYRKLRDQSSEESYRKPAPMHKKLHSSESKSASSESQQHEPQEYKKHQKTHDSTSTESREQNIKFTSSSSSSSSSEEVSRTYRKDSMKPYGDAITWNGIKIASSKKVPVTKKDIEKIFATAYETMNHVSKEQKQVFRQQLEVATQTDNEDSRLNATDLLNKYQYPVEEHTIKTDDGYLLTLFRISKDSTVPKPVVFLMHGLLGSADDWLLMGPGKSLAYLLADAGYEVWLGNARGNKYSRRHVTKHPAQSDFWQFSTDEIALHDLPAMIDYVLEISRQSSLIYVGHSMGTTAFFALAASRPQYNDKITMMYALSPMAYMANTRSPLLRMMAPTSPLSENLHQQLGHGQFKPSKEVVSTLGGAMIEKDIGVKSIAKNVNFVMSGVNVEDLDANLIPVIMSHLPAGSSTRQMKQYAQAVASNDFTKYDFGSTINQKVYGSSQPPKYNMKKIQTPVVMFYSEEDWLAHPKDVQRLVKDLPNVQAYKVQDPHFGNMAFQFSEKAPSAVYNQLISSLKDQPQTQKYVY